MRKISKKLIFAFALAATLTACGGGGGGTPSNTDWDSLVWDTDNWS